MKMHLKTSTGFEQGIRKNRTSTFLASALTFLVGLVSTAQAGTGSVLGAKVTGVYCGYYGTTNMCSVYFDKKVTYSNNTAPTCIPTSPASNEQNHRFQFKLDELGKGVLSIALTAYANKALVQADGIGACSIWADTETLNSLFIMPPGYPLFQP